MWHVPIKLGKHVSHASCVIIVVVNYWKSQSDTFIQAGWTALQSCSDTSSHNSEHWEHSVHMERVPTPVPKPLFLRSSKVKPSLIISKPFLPFMWPEPIQLNFGKKSNLFGINNWYNVIPSCEGQRWQHYSQVFRLLLRKKKKLEQQNFIWG